MGHGHFVAQAAHLAHVKFTVQTVHHASRCEEEKRFEKRVSHQMENSGGEYAHAATYKHVSQLTDGGIGQHALQIVLAEGDGGGEKCSETSDRAHSFKRRRRVRVKHIRAGHHVDAGGDHGGSVYQGADRSGAFHGV